MEASTRTDDDVPCVCRSVPPVSDVLKRGRIAAPRLLVAGACGDAGKTTLCIGLLRALRRKGLAVQAFKKGPDYIDAAWLSRASEGAARNLDVYMCGEPSVRASFLRHGAQADCSIIEGARGILDGVDAQGTYSSARLAMLLDCPAILIVSAAKVTRTAAAAVKGIQQLEPDLRLGGVVLNGLSGDRHRRVTSRAIEDSTGVPVLGALPHVRAASMPIRHLGLVTPSEYQVAAHLTDSLERLISEHVDVDSVLSLARTAPWIAPHGWAAPEEPLMGRRDVRVGILVDSAFTFYYPENLEHLERLGAELVPISALDASDLPPIDALYIGGGFPETHARALADNRPLLHAIRSLAQHQLPIYAECGGLMYLSRAIHSGVETFEMVGALPVETAMTPNPVGHGYVDAVVVGDNPFFPLGAEIKGHQFHYSKVISGTEHVDLVFMMSKGKGVRARHDGLCVNNVLATYVHVHAAGVPAWAEGLVAAADRYANRRRSLESAIEAAVG
ncbi:MAG: cobyrinate a,c-diamide synthase [Deltaproteobacteria bacterium]|nr:cobyrinate a,c-diamide synthase [Deltaproteobacteria bacterium]